MNARKPLSSMIEVAFYFRKERDTNMGYYSQGASFLGRRFRRFRPIIW